MTTLDDVFLAIHKKLQSFISINEHRVEPPMKKTARLNFLQFHSEPRRNRSEPQQTTRLDLFTAPNQAVPCGSTLWFCTKCFPIQDFCFLFHFANKSILKNCRWNFHKIKEVWNCFQREFSMVQFVAWSVDNFNLMLEASESISIQFLKNAKRSVSNLIFSV